MDTPGSTRSARSPRARFRSLRGAGLAAIALASGCAVDAADRAPETSATGGAAARLAASLPSCAGLSVKAGQPLAVEDVPGTDQIILFGGKGAATPLCAGTLDDLARFSPAGQRPPGAPPAIANNDPMPADGSHPADNDPMPAHGGGLADNDPMPAQGAQNPSRSHEVTRPYKHDP